MRNRKILEQLLNSDTYLNLDYFADFFKVSTKTISNNMKYLIKDGKSNGFDIRLKRARGYYIEINNKDHSILILKRYHLMKLSHQNIGQVILLFYFY